MQQNCTFQTHYIPWLVVGLVRLLAFIPRPLLSRMVTWWMETTSSASKLSECCLNATLDLLNPISIKNMLFLAHTELQEVLEPDYEGIERFKHHTKFYYGTTDHWVPLSYYENLVKTVPDAHVQLCTLEIPHAFVLCSSHKMAEICAEWVETDLTVHDDEDDE